MKGLGMMVGLAGAATIAQTYNWAIATQYIFDHQIEGSQLATAATRAQCYKTF